MYLVTLSYKELKSWW